MTKRYVTHRQDYTAENPVKFHRKVIKEPPQWRESKKTFTELRIEPKGLIEDVGIEYLQIDFANKMIGGGVLGRGSIQEEIRFILSPSLCVSMLCSAKLEDKEALILENSERFNNYSGYGRTFEWAGEYKDTTVGKSGGGTVIAAIDARECGTGSSQRISQWEPKYLQRELDKACDSLEGGCGAFGGYHDLKAVIQMLAVFIDCVAAEIGVPLMYCTFGVAGLGPSLKELHSTLVQNKVTVGEVYSILMDLGEAISIPSESEEDPEPPQLFTILIEKYE